MNKKKWLWLAAAGAAVLLAVLILLIVLQKPPQTIGICYRNNTTESNRAVRTALEQTLQAQGYQVLVLDADGDQAKQLLLVEELKSRGCIGLLVEPVMSDAAGELLSAIDSTGLPAVLFNRNLDTSLLAQYPNIAYIGVDIQQPGTMQAAATNQLPKGGDVNGDGSVAYVILQGPQDHISAAAGAQSLQAALPGSSCLSVSYGDWSQDSGRKLCKQLLADYGKDIEVIFCGSDEIACGVMEAIADGGRTVGEDVYIITIGQDKAPAEQGIYSATVWLDPELLAQTVCDRALALLKGQTGEQITVIPYTTVTSPS